MEIVPIFFIVTGVFIGLPVLVYMVVKFGMASYFKSKERQQKKQHEQKE